MSLLAQATNGAEVGPQMYVFVGLPGVGKSALAAQYPKPIFLDIEDGSKHIRTTRLGKDKVGTYDLFNKVVDELLTTSHNYKTVVVDSYTEVEKILREKVCADNNVATVEDIEFGKGVPKLEALHDALMAKFKALQDKGIDVVVITHTAIKSFTDPHLNTTYDRYNIQAHKALSPKLIAIADNVFFCTYQIDTATDKRTKKTQASGDGSRIMYTEWRPGHVGKNRLNLPYEMPMDYDTLKKAIAEGKPKSAAELKEAIESALVQAREKISADRLVVARKTFEDAGDDEATLERILVKLNTIINA